MVNQRAKNIIVTCSQGMITPCERLRSGKVTIWRIKHVRPSREQRRLALAMMMSLAKRFETCQDSFPTGLVTDSGFSEEDLISDLPEFYRVVSMQNSFKGLLKIRLNDYDQ